MKTFRERLGNDIILFDGGTGTYLYEKGIYINTCFDELNLTNPDIVRGVHKEYVDAGANVIETNTFGANQYKLAPHGLDDKVYEINLRGAQIAKQVAGERALVAGSVGPLGVQIEPLGKISYDEAKDAFKRQIKGLIDGGADILIFETFLMAKKLVQAIRAAKELKPVIPIIAQVTLNDEGRLFSGSPIERFLQEIADYEVDAVGFNCSVGPKLMLDGLEELKQLTDLPISIQPNAGIPQNVGGRNIYMTSPEYMAEYAKRFVQTGATIIGGCCGTNPAHIRAMSRAISALQPMRQVSGAHIEKKRIEAPEEINVTQFSEKSRLANKISKGEFVKLVELVSPRGITTDKVLERAKKLYYNGVDAINIPDGPRAGARMSALAMSVLIQREVGIEAILHFACRDRNIIGIQSDLLGAWAMGLRNILAITGDPPKLGNYPDATAVFDVDAIGLTNILNHLNHGLDMIANPIGKPTAYSIGVGVNPGAINLDEEIRRLHWKVEAGAEYMITQPVFDISILETFMKKIEDVKLPLICGIWPLISYRNAEFMNNEVPGATVPKEVLERLKKAKTKEEGLAEGIAIARETYEYIKPHVAGVQMAAPLGRVSAVLEVM